MNQLGLNMKAIKREFDAVIFDIDNVLADTRSSYTDCVRETVQIYLEKIFQFSSSKGKLLSKKDIEKFKLLGGFNDDWDTSYGLLLYLLSLNSKTKSTSALKQLINLAHFSKKVKAPVYVKGIERICGKNSQVSIPKIARAFQALYFKKYINREWPVLPKSTFEKLKKSGIKLGIATGRNRTEARYVLKRFGIRRFFGKIICVNDLPSGRFKKPHPYSLLKIAAKYGLRKKYLYIGDLPDDIQMAREASRKIYIEGWGFPYLSSEKKEMEKGFRKAGAKRIVRTKSELIRLLNQLTSR